MPFHIEVARPRDPLRVQLLGQDGAEPQTTLAQLEDPATLPQTARHETFENDDMRWGVVHDDATSRVG